MRRLTLALFCLALFGFSILSTTSVVEASVAGEERLAIGSQMDPNGRA